MGSENMGVYLVNTTPMCILSKSLPTPSGACVLCFEDHSSRGHSTHNVMGTPRKRLPTRILANRPLSFLIAIIILPLYNFTSFPSSVFFQTAFLSGSIAFSIGASSVQQNLSQNTDLVFSSDCLFLQLQA